MGSIKRSSVPRILHPKKQNALSLAPRGPHAAPPVLGQFPITFIEARYRRFGQCLKPWARGGYRRDKISSSAYRKKKDDIVRSYGDAELPKA
jgi:hypothetical protein